MTIMSFPRVVTIFATCSILLMSSCVREEYRISEDSLNMEVTIFQEGVSLPLGSTDPLKMSQLVDQLDPEMREMLQANDGAYSFFMADKFDFSEQLAFLSDNLSIDAFTINRNIPFNLQDVDVSDVNVPEKNISFEQDLAEVIGPLDISLDPIKLKPVIETADLSSYLPDDESLDLDLGKYHNDIAIAALSTVDISKYEKDPRVAPYWEIELPIEQVQEVLHEVGETDFDISTRDNLVSDDAVEIALKIPFPEAIKEVKAIHLHEGAQVTVTVDLSDNLFFTSGNIVPHVDLDVHDIFHLTDDENAKHPLHIDHIEDDFILSDQTPNKYYMSRTYDIQDINLNYNIRDKDEPREKGDFYWEDGHLVLDKLITAAPDLSLRYENLTTSLKEISRHSEDAEVMMYIDLEFHNFNIDNADVVVDPIITTVEKVVDLNISETLPNMINGINKVTFTPESGLDIDINVKNVDRIKGLDFAIETLELTFPEGIDVEGAVNNKLDLNIGSLDGAGVKRHVRINGISFDPSMQQHGSVIFNADIGVRAISKVSVKEGSVINTRDLPRNPSEDISLEVSSEVILGVSDYEADFAGYYSKIDEQEIFEFNVPAEVAEMESVTIVPETVDGSAAMITIDVAFPETGLEFGTSDKGVTLDFPDMIVFKELAPGLDMKAGNVLEFNGILPSHIELPIDYIIVNAQKDEGTGEYKVQDLFKAVGEVGLFPARVSKEDIDALTANKAVASFSAYMPEMVPSTVNIDRYQAPVSGENIGLGENIDLSSLPKEIVSLEEILLKDVVLDIDVEAKGIRELVKDADVDLLLNITLPDAVIVEEGYLNADGDIEIKGTLDGEEIKIDPIGIRGLRLNKTIEEVSEYLSGLEIKYGGNISINDAKLDMSAIENADLGLDVNVRLASRASDKIEIAGVVGKVDYQIKPIVEEIELGSLLKDIDGLEATLDLNRFSLAIDLKTNISVPLLADLSIIPYKDGAVISGRELKKNLEITMPEATDEPALVRFWISNYPQGEDKYMPAGYEHISLDLLSLIAAMPDKIELVLNAGTDPEKTASVAPSEDGYVLEAEYALSLPLEFGEDAAIEFRQVIDDLPVELGTILQYGSLGLIGEIENSLPLGFEMTYNFLDSEGKVIELIEDAGSQVINPGTAGGDAVKTKINLLVGVKKNADMTDINSLELVFKMTSVPGAPIREDSYIKASLQALIPEGVTLDLSQFMENEDDEN